MCLLLSVSANNNSRNCVGGEKVIGLYRMSLMCGQWVDKGVRFRDLTGGREGSVGSTLSTQVLFPGWKSYRGQSSTPDYVVYRRLAELYSYHEYPRECGSDINSHSSIVCFDYNVIRIDQEHVYSMECVFIVECANSIDKVYLQWAPMKIVEGHARSFPSTSHSQ